MDGVQVARQRKKRDSQLKDRFPNRLRLVRRKRNSETDLGSETIRMLGQLDQEVRIEVDARGCAAAASK
jgi:hypothetical protein